jgi:hypothetical protein
MNCKFTDEFTLDVEFDYSPEEPMIMYPNDMAHPGYPAEVTVNSVKLDGLELIDTISDITLAAIEEECFKDVEDRYSAMQDERDNEAERRLNGIMGGNHG